MLRRGGLLLAAAAAVAFTGTAYAETQPTLDQDAIAFGTRPAVQSLDLSPDGSRAVFVGAGPGRTTIVYVADIAAGANKPILYSKGSPEEIQQCFFASNARLICQFTMTIVSDGIGAPAGVLIPVLRTISLNVDGSDIKPLGQPSTSSDIGIRQFDGEVIDWLPGSENDVLMTRLFLAEGSRGVPTNVQRTKHGIGVVRLNVANLNSETIEQPLDSAAEWMSDGQGHVRLLGTWEMSGETYETGRVKYVYRSPGSREWKDLAGYLSLTEFRPLAIDGPSNSLFAMRKLSGHWALSRLSLDETPDESVVALESSRDVDRVVAIGKSGRVIGYGYQDDPRRPIYIDPSFKSLASALTAALPSHGAVTFVGESNDKSKIALFAGAESDPGRYYLFDTARKSLGELVPVRPSLTGHQLATVRNISFPVTDGSQLAARLFLPAATDSKSLPTVIFAGGDTKDTYGFEWLAQFLAARGYAVMEPQIRGLAGEDTRFNFSEFKNWRTSVADLAAAARYVGQQGIADPKRVAVAGWSRGAYDALLSAEADPSLYKAVIGIAPIADLAAYKEEWSEYTMGKRVEEAVGSAQSDASPVRRAASIEAPVLLFHGTLDIHEHVSQSRSMREALQKLGKQVELVEFAGLDRDFDDSTARAQMLLKMGQLLDKTIGH